MSEAHLKIAKALLRRLAVPYEIDTDKRTSLIVMPFGLSLTYRDAGYRSGYTLIERVRSRGMVMPAFGVGIPSRLYTDLAQVLTQLDRLFTAGLPYRSWVSTSAGLSYYAPDSADMTHVSSRRPFVVFDPLESMVLDVQWANKTGKGEPRDWIAEAREAFPNLADAMPNPSKAGAARS